MVTKRASRQPRYNFLRRQSTKKDAKKTLRKGFAFGDPVVRAARKGPVAR